MAQANSVKIEGNLTKDAGFRPLPSGDFGLSFSIGHNNEYQKSGEAIKESFFFQVESIVKKDKADEMKAALTKGAFVHIEGKLRTRTFGEGDQKRTVTEIFAFEVRKVEFKKAEAAA